MKLIPLLGLILLPLCIFASALHDAVEEGNLAEVKSLIAKGEDLNAQNSGYMQTPLQLAVYNENSDIVKVLIKAGADVNLKMKNGHTALHTAAFFGDTKSITFILRAKADVNAKSNDGTTPLHRAAEGGDTETIKLLLSYGAKIDAKTNDLTTPLHVAAFLGNAGATKVLLKNGADIKAKNILGHTALKEAIDAEETKTIKVLQAAGAK